MMMREKKRLAIFSGSLMFFISTTFALTNYMSSATGFIDTRDSAVAGSKGVYTWTIDTLPRGMFILIK